MIIYGYITGTVMEYNSLTATKKSNRILCYHIWAIYTETFIRNNQRKEKKREKIWKAFLDNPVDLQGELYLIKRLGLIDK